MPVQARSQNSREATSKSHPQSALLMQYQEQQVELTTLSAKIDRIEKDRTDLMHSRDIVMDNFNRLSLASARHTSHLTNALHLLCKKYSVSGEELEKIFNTNYEATKNALTLDPLSKLSHSAINAFLHGPSHLRERSTPAPYPKSAVPAETETIIAPSHTSSSSDSSSSDSDDSSDSSSSCQTNTQPHTKDNLSLEGKTDSKRLSSKPIVQDNKRPNSRPPSSNSSRQNGSRPSKYRRLSPSTNKLPRSPVRRSPNRDPHSSSRESHKSRTLNGFANAALCHADPKFSTSLSRSAQASVRQARNHRNVSLNNRYEEPTARRLTATERESCDRYYAEMERKATEEHVKRREAQKQAAQEPATLFSRRQRDQTSRAASKDSKSAESALGAPVYQPKEYPAQPNEQSKTQQSSTEDQDALISGVLQALANESSLPRNVNASEHGSDVADDLGYRNAQNEMENAAQQAGGEEEGTGAERPLSNSQQQAANSTTNTDELVLHCMDDSGRQKGTTSLTQPPLNGTSSKSKQLEDISMEDEEGTLTRRASTTQSLSLEEAAASPYLPQLRGLDGRDPESPPVTQPPAALPGARVVEPGRNSAEEVGLEVDDNGVEGEDEEQEEEEEERGQWARSRRGSSRDHDVDRRPPKTPEGAPYDSAHESPNELEEGEALSEDDDQHHHHAHNRRIRDRSSSRRYYNDEQRFYPDPSRSRSRSTGPPKHRKLEFGNRRGFQPKGVSFSPGTFFTSQHKSHYHQYGHQRDFDVNNGGASAKCSRLKVGHREYHHQGRDDLERGRRSPGMEDGFVKSRRRDDYQLGDHEPQPRWRLGTKLQEGGQRSRSGPRSPSQALAARLSIAPQGRKGSGISSNGRGKYRRS